MARVFISGSSTGLGFMAGQLLVEQGHRVVLHARNPVRAENALEDFHGAEGIVIGDLTTVAGMRSVAEQVNSLGRFDAVIHNAGVGNHESPTKTEDGLPHVFAVNTLAPYVLTALIETPSRLVYVSSKLHRSVQGSLQDLTWERRTWAGVQAYAESKVHDVMLAFVVARRWPAVLSNALEPGWVPTRMGGAEATDDLDQGHRTQAWLAVSDDTAARVTGEYFYHLSKLAPNPETRNEVLQEELMEACERFSGIRLPA
jgi:NAD(P)-dependent dehydrogenase (short-subunit alcohol dehydrogenase family)